MSPSIRPGGRCLLWPCLWLVMAGCAQSPALPPAPPSPAEPEASLCPPPEPSEPSPIDPWLAFGQQLLQSSPAQLKLLRQQEERSLLQFASDAQRIRLALVLGYYHPGQRDPAQALRQLKQLKEPEALSPAIRHWLEAWRRQWQQELQTAQRQQQDSQRWRRELAARDQQLGQLQAKLKALSEIEQSINDRHK